VGEDLSQFYFNMIIHGVNASSADLLKNSEAVPSYEADSSVVAVLLQKTVMIHYQEAYISQLLLSSLKCCKINSILETLYVYLEGFKINCSMEGSTMHLGSLAAKTPDEP
jgi:hypothetical protein